MKENKMIDILIPTADRGDVIGLCLQSIGMQTILPTRVIVYDNGSTSIFSDYKNRMIWDILSEKGIKTQYHRSNKRIGITAARRFLLNEVGDYPFMFVDDDALLEPDYIEILSAQLASYSLSINFVGGLFLLPNNEMGKADFSTEKIDIELPDIQAYQLAFFRYSCERNLPIEYGGINGVLFKKQFRTTMLEALKDFPDKAPLEDFLLTGCVGKGMLVTKAVCWHLMSPEQIRDWDESLDLMFRKKFQNDPKGVIDFMKENNAKI